MLQHLARDMTGDIHDGPIAGAAFGEFRDQGVPRIMKSSLDARAVPGVDPAGL
jgi:hypothetical protein